MKKSALFKTLIVVVSVIFALLLWEVGMRLTGERVHAVQESGNEIHPEDTDKIRILALGESTTADPFILGKSNAWPRQLERRLAKQGINARVYNLGKTAIPSTEIMKSISEQLDKYRPHIVISMMGINDENVVSWEESWWSRLRVGKLFRWWLGSNDQPLPKIAGESNCRELALENIKSGWEISDGLALVFLRCAYLAERERGHSGEMEWVELLTKLRGKEFAERFLETKDTTTKNYQDLHRLLTERHIVHIAMQYPTRPIEWLKKILSGPEFQDTLFVENKKNFEKQPYEFLFEDRFAGDFGHTNAKGNSLIAESALHGVLEAIQRLKSTKVAQ